MYAVYTLTKHQRSCGESKDIRGAQSPPFSYSTKVFEPVRSDKMASSSQLLPRILKVSSAFAILTGSLDTILGVKALGGASVFTPGSATTAFADSQFRFLGSMWASYGVVLWWVSNDVKNRKVPLALMGGMMFVGGLGRVLSEIQHGCGAAWVRGAIVVELLGPVGLYLLGRSQGYWA